MRALGVMAMGLALAGCATTAEPARKPLDSAAVSKQRKTAPASLVGQDGDDLIRMFGTPILDAREMKGRKLQFGNTKCVLDAYLYPKSKREPEVIHVDTRNREGEKVDPEGCIASLLKH